MVLENKDDDTKDDDTPKENKWDVFGSSCLFGIVIAIITWLIASNIVFFTRLPNLLTVLRFFLLFNALWVAHKPIGTIADFNAVNPSIYCPPPDPVPLSAALPAPSCPRCLSAQPAPFTATLSAVAALIWG